MVFTVERMDDVDYQCTVCAPELFARGSLPYNCPHSPCFRKKIDTGTAKEISVSPSQDI